MPTIHDAQLLSLLDDGWFLTFQKEQEVNRIHLTGCHGPSGRQVCTHGSNHMEAISLFCKYLSSRLNTLPSIEKETVNGN